MQRYEPKPWDIRHCDMVPADEGNYVLYCDAQAEITQLRVEIEKLREDYTELLGSNEALTFKLVDAEAERDGLLEHSKLEEARGDKLKTERDEARAQV